MPDEYISRAKALSAVQKQRGANRSPAQNAMLDRICCDIKKVPAADVAEVRHGRWIHHEDGVFTCSECGNAESNDSYYCRLCGAKMDGAAE
jgi:hypothetical protein